MSTPRILVVEDEGIIAMGIVKRLGRLGYEVVGSVDSGEEAVVTALELLPDLILMDINLGSGIDGVEAATQIRAQCSAPVIYLTAHSDAATLDRAKRTEPLGFIVKPYEDKDLHSAIEIGLYKHSMDRQLREQKQWLAATLACIGDGVIATDTHQRVTFMNPEAERLTQWSQHEARGHELGQILELKASSGDILESPLQEALRERRSVSLPPDTQLKTKLGEALDIDDSAAPIVDENGNLLGGVVVFRDVTARKELEGRVARSERLASLGTMSAGMAHELNNPLGVILGNVDVARELVQDLLDSLQEGAPPAQLKKDFAEVSAALGDCALAGERVRKLVLSLKKFTRSDAQETSAIDLREVLETALKLCENQVRHCATVIREYNTVPRVQANEAQLVQVFTNLLVNASQAIGEGRAASNSITLITQTTATGEARVSIRDTGRGIPKELQRKIFDPFFSTKPVGSGMGIGLAVSHGILTALGGTIKVESKVGEGCTMLVELPPDNTPASEEPSHFSEICNSSGRGRILVIDDEIMMTQLLSRVLGTEHEVTTETQALPALSRLDRGETFDAIVCDMTMPDVNGLEVFTLLSNTHPDMARRLVFVTGGAISEESRAFLDSVPNFVVNKPVDIPRLRSIIASFVSDQSAAA